MSILLLLGMPNVSYPINSNLLPNFVKYLITSFFKERSLKVHFQQAERKNASVGVYKINIRRSFVLGWNLRDKEKKFNQSRVEL